MPTPKTPKPIKITVTGGVIGTPLTVRNRTTGDEIHTVLKQTGKAVVDLQNFTDGYTVGDDVDFIVSGEVIGTASLTTTATSQSVTIATSAIISGLKRGI